MELPTLTLWVCEYTLKPLYDSKAIERHKLKVSRKSEPIFCSILTLLCAGATRQSIEAPSWDGDISRGRLVEEFAADLLLGGRSRVEPTVN